MMKKIALLLSLLLALTCAALADEEKPTTYYYDEYAYQLLPDGTAKIVNLRRQVFENNRISKTLDVDELPAELDGHPVTALAWGSFHNANRLTTLTLPDSIVSIDGNPFTNCSALTAFIVSPDHPALYTIDGVLFSRADDRLISFPAGRRMTHYDVPQGTKVIGMEAFYGAEELESVTLPDGLERIEKGGFFSCDSLAKVEFGEGLISIGEEAFFYNLSLREMHFPDTLEVIGEAAFSSCRALERVTLPESLLRLEEKAFSSCYALTSVVIPEGTVSIGQKAFIEDKALKQAVIPASVTSIGWKAFDDCPVTLVVQEDSYAQEWAEAHQIPFAKE